LSLSQGAWLSLGCSQGRGIHGDNRRAPDDGQRSLARDESHRDIDEVFFEIGGPMPIAEQLDLVDEWRSELGT
jgi:hypothetical protein